MLQSEEELVLSKNDEGIREVVSPENDEKIREILAPFHSNEDDCDVLVVTKDKDLLFRSTVLNLISKAFQESWTLNDNNQDGRKVVEMKDTDGDVVVKALSFYYPKSFENVQGILHFYKQTFSSRLAQSVEHSPCNRKVLQSFA